MKKLYLILFFIPIILCGQSLHYSNNSTIKIYVDKIINRDTFLLYPAYFENIDSFDLINDSIPNGRYNAYYNDKSTLAFTVYFHHFKVNGMMYSYSKKGVNQSVVSFKNGIAHGPYILYYDNNKVKEIGNYLNGEPDGVAFSYFENGKIRQLNNYKNGRREGLVESYYLNENIQSSGVYQYDYRIGKHTIFYPDGNVWFQDTFVDSIRQKEIQKIEKWEEEATASELNFSIHSIEYDESGNKISEDFYNDFEIIKIIEYYLNGKVKTITNYIGSHYGSCLELSYDIKEGLSTEYFLNGNKKSEGNYNHNKKSGDWRYWNQNGKLIKTENHKKLNLK